MSLPLHIWFDDHRSEGSRRVSCGDVAKKIHVAFRTGAAAGCANPDEAEQPASHPSGNAAAAKPIVGGDLMAAKPKLQSAKHGGAKPCG